MILLLVGMQRENVPFVIIEPAGSRWDRLHTASISQRVGAIRERRTGRSSHGRLLLTGISASKEEAERTEARPATE